MKRVIAAIAASLGLAVAGGVQAEDLKDDRPRPGTAQEKEGFAARVDDFIDDLLDRGFVIPQPHRESLRPFDKDADARISRSEFDAAPRLDRGTTWTADHYAEHAREMRLFWDWRTRQHAAGRSR